MSTGEVAALNSSRERTAATTSGYPILLLLLVVVLLWLIAVPTRRSVDGDGGRSGHRLELVEADTDRQVPASGEAEVGRRLVAADPEREHFGP